MDCPAVHLLLFCHTVELGLLRDSTLEVVTMSLRVKAIICGIVIESVLLGLIFSGIEFGDSCKPGGFGLVLIYLHYPALILGPHLPEWLTILIATGFGIAAWSVVAYALLRLPKFPGK
jgi:FtsH-binding integral membrane protein